MTRPDEYADLMRGIPPRWAGGWGEDEHGGFVEMWVGRVAQRFRWVPPGWFMMGSPQAEKGRDSDEGPQHKVTLTRGFWLADTPCTQAFWQAVLKDEKNPSRFQSVDRPVEQVSWDDAKRFIEALNRMSEGPPFRLPTEAEWEYACRAGTTTSTYAGELKILGDNNGPILDDIAWYGGNSGVGFELENGYDSSDWKEKQYEHSRAGTHPVKKKKPNKWGLHDMLGNVWEWCEDWKETHGTADEVDPPCPSEGDYRVIRGGSWSDLARYVRAADRYWLRPDFRDYDLGFRLARGQSASSQAGDGRSPESR